MTHRKYKFPSPELRAAFPRTLPILMGYLFLGFAFGVLLGSRGYGALTSFLASTLVYAGSLQFVAVELLGQFNLLQAALVALMVNARHLFYGLSMLERFRGTGRYKPYLIFSLTDETYSLYCAGPVPPGLREDRFLFSLAWLDHLYWIAGSVLGSAASWLIPFETQGIEFVMTALFTVIFLGQWEGAAPRTAARKDRIHAHLPALIGVGVSLVCLPLFGRDAFLLPAMAVILLTLTALRWQQKRKEASHDPDAS